MIPHKDKVGDLTLLLSSISPPMSRLHLAREGHRRFESSTIGLKKWNLYGLGYNESDPTLPFQAISEDRIFVLSYTTVLKHVALFEGVSLFRQAVTPLPAPVEINQFPRDLQHRGLALIELREWLTGIVGLLSLDRLNDKCPRDELHFIGLSYRILEEDTAPYIYRRCGEERS
ncbi:hypothetical protein TNCV_679271 [Trichonephila clavipes]|nr:hypothetical protein TNCV_679271 [Trichonephila clavipes]